MKQFITMIVAACAFLAVSAQHPMVTLSHNGELKFFTNLTAFESAYDAAVNGDTIFLSQGEFIVNSGKLDIKKRLSIVGNGYGSHILGNITINMHQNPNSVIEAPLFDGVRLDKLYFTGSDTKNNLDISEIRRCWIRTLDNGAYAGNNVAYDKCYIESADFNGTGTVLLKNSKVGRATFLYNTTAVNCNINLNSYYPLSSISCIFHKSASTSELGVNGDTANIINCLLDFKPTASNLYQHECYYIENPSEPILDEKLNCTVNLTETGYLGQDKTVVGIQGGEYPFSENPSMPSVDTDKSSVVYDAENNKLKVNITVKAD